MDLLLPERGLPAVNVRSCILAPETRPSALGQLRSLPCALMYVIQELQSPIPTAVISFGDGLVVNEHHSTFYSMMPSCSIIAGALAVSTKQAKICVFGTPIGVIYPHRLAEEYAMLDVMSGGRLECAFPLRTGMEYWINPINPSFARERFREGMEILMQAWTQPGPTRYDGKFCQYKYLNPFPTPYQKPHPMSSVQG